jgi:hypothetical protein
MRLLLSLVAEEIAEKLKLSSYCRQEEEEAQESGNRQAQHCVHSASGGALTTGTRVLNHARSRGYFVSSSY